MKKLFIAFLAAASVAAVRPASADTVETGTAHLRGTAPGSTLEGKITFQETAEGLKVTGTVRNASPGKHGFHVHQFGDCADSGKAAGDHYNPDGVHHGHLLKDGLLQAHAGDLGNFEVGADGSGSYEALVPGLTLSGGKYSVGGRAVVFHEKVDDFAQPAGNAGARSACGEIVLVRG